MREEAVTGWTHHSFAQTPELTVLCVCVAACVRAVCVAPVVVVVELARKRGLVLFHAELVMVRAGSAERETEDDRVLFTHKHKQKGPERKSETGSLTLRPEARKRRGKKIQSVFLFIFNAATSLKASRVIGTTMKLKQTIRQKLWPRVL